MAVYTPLDDDTLRALLARYPGAGALERAEGVAAGSINTVYRLTTSTGRFYLRVNEGKPLEDVRYEAALLDELARRPLPFEAPRLLRNDAGEPLTPFRPGQPVGLFPEIAGEELDEAEVRPDHLRQLGAALARAHLALRGFRAGRRNPFGDRTVRAWLHEVEPHLAPALLTTLRARFEACAHERRPLPRGVVHGDLFRNNTKWQQGRLHAIFDWEMAGRDHLALDLAITLNAWCFDLARGYDLEAARALTDGYARVRPLTAPEQRGLYAELLFGALRFTLSRVRDFELRPDAGDRDHLDYRDYAARSEALAALGPRAVREALFA